MAKSARWRKAVNSISGEQPLILLEIIHPTLTTPVRVVNDIVDVTSKGNVYSACAFRVTWPSDDDNGYTESQLQIDNIGRELTQWLEISRGGVGARCRLIQVLRDFPDDWEAEYLLELTNLNVDLTTISGTLGYKEVFDQPLMALQYRTEIMPEMF